MAIENVAILFTDVVGSTEFSQRLSPEAAEEVRRGHFSILRQAIAEVGGDEVKNLGDGLMVAFTSPSVALALLVERNAPASSIEPETSLPKLAPLLRPTATRESNDGPKQHSPVWLESKSRC